jgi:hypothetical protein
MDTESRESQNPDYQMGTTECTGDVLRGGSGIVEVRISQQEDANRGAASIAVPDRGEGRAAPARAMQHLDQMTSVCTLPDKTTGRLHVAVPTNFSGRKEDYRRFRRQIGLFLTANRKDFENDKSMIIFALSYMTEGAAEQWANSYID